MAQKFLAKLTKSNWSLVKSFRARSRLIKTSLCRSTMSCKVLSQLNNYSSFFSLSLSHSLIRGGNFHKGFSRRETSHNFSPLSQPRGTRARGDLFNFSLLRPKPFSFELFTRLRFDSLYYTTEEKNEVDKNARVFAPLSRSR